MCKKQRKLNKKLLAMSMLIGTLSLAGCSNTLDKESEVSITPYERISYDTVPVMKGDITPEYEVFLHSEDKKMVDYYPCTDNISLKKIYVSEGDYVRGGEILAEFECEQIDDAIKSYESEIEENEILIDHYKKLQEIDDTQNYDEDIKLLNEQLEVARLYISELQAKKKDYSIVAEREGVVSKIYDINNTKNLSSDVLIMTVTYGSGIYRVNMDKYDFAIDEEINISYDGADIAMKVIDIDDSKQIAYLKIEDEVILNQATISMIIKKQTLKDVVYIPNKSIFQIDGKTYVYMLDENGYRYAREIEIGEQFDDLIIVTSGLSEGEEVVK